MRINTRNGPQKNDAVRERTEGLAQSRGRLAGSALTISERFRQFAHTAAEFVGCAWAFVLAIVLVLIWVVTGPRFHFSDTWQLVINTATTIITFLMVFLIQNTQNRD